MLVPTFVDLQGFIVNKKFIVKKVAVLKQGTVLTHYIFTNPVPWKFLTRGYRLLPEGPPSPPPKEEEEVRYWECPVEKASKSTPKKETKYWEYPGEKASKSSTSSSSSMSSKYKP
ncbi:hypothetical protein ALC57_12592 [Trachymyrmex cornetzi]|uniref:Uncharacterized protein n=1 Tax=Trachymyrmex cornetzi TaxID=471704 RepID=A0A151J0T6_9HYME|nr:hypothetical protein ALC57_12592 [Trachymyrmex cornetzi]